jgi:hypothetical protein
MIVGKSVLLMRNTQTNTKIHIDEFQRADEIFLDFELLMCRIDTQNKRNTSRGPFISSAAVRFAQFCILFNVEIHDENDKIDLFI